MATGEEHAPNRSSADGDEAPLSDVETQQRENERDDVWTADAALLESGHERLEDQEGKGNQPQSIDSDEEDEQEEGEEHGEEEEEHGEEEEDEEEEEDDDHVRQSWATEKEEDAEEDEEDTQRFRFRDDEHDSGTHHDVGGDEDGEHDEEDDDDDESFGSLEWVTRQLRRIESRRQEVLATPHSDDDSAALERDDDVENSVRDALRLLNTSDNADDAQEEDEENVAETRPFYFDIVAEAMELDWRHADETDDRAVHKHEEVDTYTASEDRPYEDFPHNGRDDDEEEEKNIGSEEGTEEQDLGDRDDKQETREASSNQEDDEWLEAYTAKGRVYYYNRRTRESSWTRPVTLPVEEEKITQRTTSPSAASAKSEASQSLVDVLANSSTQPSRSNSRHENPASSTSSSSHSSTSHRPKAASVPAREEEEDALYCCFCGRSLPGARGFRLHMHECSTLLRHKRSSSTLYSQFQEMLTVLSEDATLRSMHYAASFPDAVPHSFESPTQQSIRQSLSLLRRQRHPPASTRRRSHDDEIPSFQPTGFTAPAPSRRVSSGARSAPSSSVRAKSKSTTSAFAAPQPSSMETCRHCGRSFAEGRLAKHEAVCPRVFGNETAWGRGGAASGRTSTTEQHQQILRSLQRRHTPQLSSKVKQHNLKLTFREHQASLVECPCCRRKFAPSGAKEHIEICRTVQHRPRNPVPLLKDFATAS